MPPQVRPPPVKQHADSFEREVSDLVKSMAASTAQLNGTGMAAGTASAGQTGDAASQVVTGIDTLTQQSNQLSAQLDRFLTKIRRTG